MLNYLIQTTNCRLVRTPNFGEDPGCIGLLKRGLSKNSNHFKFKMINRLKLAFLQIKDKIWSFDQIF